MEPMVARRDQLTHSQLQDLWRNRVKDAYERYIKANTNYRDALNDQQQLIVRGLEGSLAVTLASHEECTAYAEYVRALTILKDLVVHGKVPPDEEAQQSEKLVMWTSG